MVLESDPTDNSLKVDAGWPVVAAGGATLGVVEGVHPNELIVSVMTPAPDVLFVPAEAVDEIESDRVYLRVPMAAVAGQRWALIPAINETSL